MKKEIRPGTSNGNRIGNQGDANVTAPKCNICYKTVRTNSKRLMCEHCKLLVHLNCANVNLKIENSKIARLWSCHACTLRELSLYHQDVLPMNKKEVAVDNYINIHMSQNFKNSKHTSVYAILIHNQWHRLLTSSKSWLTNQNSTSPPYPRHG